MSDESIILIFIGVGAGLAGLFYFFRFLTKRQQERDEIYYIKKGFNVFLAWNYPHQEWSEIAEEYFEIKPRRLSENARVSFTDKYIYVTNGKNEILYELIGQQRYVKHLTDIYLLKQSSRNVLRFEVRTKIIKVDDDGEETLEENYSLETFYVPVPKGLETEGGKVLDFYKKFLDENADAVAAVMPYGLGLFRK